MFAYKLQKGIINMAKIRQINRVMFNYCIA